MAEQTKKRSMTTDDETWNLKLQIFEITTLSSHRKRKLFVTVVSAYLDCSSKIYQNKTWSFFGFFCQQVIFYFLFLKKENIGTRRNNHSELLDEELPTFSPQQGNRLHCVLLLCGKLCSMKSDCWCNYYWPTSLWKLDFVCLHCKQIHVHHLLLCCVSDKQDWSHKDYNFNCAFTSSLLHESHHFDLHTLSFHLAT